MACTLSLVSSALLGNGEKMIRGSLVLDSNYASGGETLDLSSYFLSTSYPTVEVGNGGGYQLNHDQGTAAAGKVVCYYENHHLKNGADVNQIAVEAIGVDLSALNVTFTAIGRPY